MDFTTFIITNRARPALLDRAEQSLRASDVGSDYETYVHPSGMPFLEFFVLCFERALAAGRRYVLQVEDDVVVHTRILAALRNWPARRSVLFGAGYAFVSRGVARDRGRQGRCSLGVYRNSELTHGSCVVLLDCARLPEVIAAMRRRLYSEGGGLGGDLLLSGAVSDLGLKVYLHEPSLAETDLLTSTIRTDAVSPDHAALDNFKPTWSPQTRIQRSPAVGADAWARHGTIDTAVLLAPDVYRLHLLPEAPVVIDGGAHIGAVSLRVLAIRPQAEVVAIEMDPENADLLRTNLWPAGDRARVVEAALVGVPTAEARISCLHGPYNTVGHFILDPRAVGAGSVFSPNQARPAQVAMTSLDELVLDLPKIDLLKLDIEGSEFGVLMACLATTLDRIERIAVEIHPWAMAEGAVEQLGARLLAAGFVIEAQHGGGGITDQWVLHATRPWSRPSTS